MASNLEHKINRFTYGHFDGGVESGRLQSLLGSFEVYAVLPNWAGTRRRSAEAAVFLRLHA